MSAPPRRPVLSLKARPKPPAPAGSRWKCKPCGAVVVVTGAEAPESDIRCPACSARLGVAADFHAPTPSSRIRARRLAD